MHIPGIAWPPAASFSPVKGVDVLYTNMDDHQPSLYRDFLTEEEVARAERIRDNALSRYAIISRGFMRALLGDRLGISPSDVSIATLKYGKPVLTTTMNSGLAFNISHSHNILVMAVSEKNPVGIDIEMIDPSANPVQASSVAFAQDEKEYLEKSTDPLSDFYKIWTGKEAILKATGDGFAYPSRNFSVISSKNSCLRQRVTGEVTANRVCDLHHFSIFNGFTGALAIIFP
jgi:4'-phosphopantetheinyl transferase